MAFEERRELFHFKDAGATSVVILSAFEHAKKGDFTRFDGLIDLFSPSMPIGDAFSALTLLSYGAPLSVWFRAAPGIRERLQDDTLLIQHLCISMALSGMIPMAELAVDYFCTSVAGKIESDFPYALSMAFEPERADLFLGPQPIDESIDVHEIEPALPDIDAYRRAAHSAFDAIEGLYGTNPTQCYRDAVPIDLEHLAEQLLFTLPEAFDNEEIVTARVLLEAATGVDMAPWYRNGTLDRLHAAARIEALFDLVDLSRFRTGQRYFFGHPIPD